MTLKSACSVHVEKPQDSLAEVMNRIRLWLDDHRIQPADFRTSTVSGLVAVDISFHREDEAELFATEFAGDAPH